LGFISCTQRCPFKLFSKFCKRVQNEKKVCLISKIRSVHEEEFENLAFKDFCVENGFKHEFCTLTSPQQNSVVERKKLFILKKWKEIC